MSPLRTLLAVLGVSLLATTASAETVVIRVLGFYFAPREVVIQPGDTVRWEWTAGTHTVTEGTDGLVNGNELFHSPLTSSVPSYSFTFTPQFLAANPMPGGRYDYFCLHHFTIGMNGIIRVGTPPPGNTYCYGDGSGTACPCANVSTEPVGCMNSVLQGGRLRGIGTASVAADTVELWVNGPSEGSGVLFFQGSSAIGSGAVFGDGLRCAGGSIHRLGRTFLSFGWAKYPGAGNLPISVRGAVQPGTTRYYQAWYFDSPGACGPPTTNFTNGYSVVWN